MSDGDDRAPSASEDSGPGDAPDDAGGAAGRDTDRPDREDAVSTDELDRDGAAPGSARDDDRASGAEDPGSSTRDGEQVPEPTGSARIAAALDLRAALTRSAVYALAAALVAFAVHSLGTVRGLGDPDLVAAVATDLGRSTGTFAVSYPVVLAINTIGRRTGATRAVAARTDTPTKLYMALTVAVTLLLFYPVIDAIVQGRPY